ncbi:hypothetical protein EMIT051CA3_40421 [Pseudomonas chlororaphis]
MARSEKVGLFRGAPGMARCAKRNQLGCGGHTGDWEVKFLYATSQFSDLAAVVYDFSPSRGSMAYPGDLRVL